MRRIVALGVVLWVVSWAEADDSMQRMLPLAVGNRWEYQLHVHFPYGPTYEIPILINITHTEEIYGHVYYVFSDPPVDWEHPWVTFPIPFFFLAGKKVRWSSDGKDLLFRWPWVRWIWGESHPRDHTAIFRFGRDYKVREIYIIYPALLGSKNNYLADSDDFAPGFPYLTDGVNPPFAGYPDHSVTVESSFSEEGYRVVEFRFPERVEFTSSNVGLHEARLSATFAEGLGLFAAYGETTAVWCDPYFYSNTNCYDDISPHMSVSLRLESAVIGGLRWAAGEPVPTAVQERSWGAVKQRFLGLNYEE